MQKGQSSRRPTKAASRRGEGLGLRPAAVALAESRNKLSVKSSVKEIEDELHYRRPPA